MNQQNKLILDTNRHHLKSIEAGYMSGIYFPTLEKIMREELDPGYGPFAHDHWDSVAKFMVDLYQRYDAWLAVNPNWEPTALKYGMTDEDISWLDTRRHQSNQILAGSSPSNFDLHELLRVLLRLNPAYQYGDESEQPRAMIREVYRLYDQRIEAAKPSKKKA